MQAESDEENVVTCIPSTSQRSPTSKGCMTNKKIIASKIVFRVLPNMKTATRSCELRKTKKRVVAISRMRSQRANTIRPTTTLAIWWSLFTAVLVSLRVRARALRSRNAFTYRIMPFNDQLERESENERFV